MKQSSSQIYRSPEYNNLERNFGCIDTLVTWGGRITGLSALVSAVNLLANQKAESLIFCLIPIGIGLATLALIRRGFGLGRRLNKRDGINSNVALKDHLRRHDTAELN